MCRYKWGKESPYSPEEQAKIRSAEHVGWYRRNIEKIKVVAPEDWLYRHGDTVKVLIGKDKGKTGIVTQVSLYLFHFNYCHLTWSKM